MIGAIVFFVVTTVLSALAWIVRTLIDYRRWHRLSKVQAEAHAKLLDRFTANDELIAYVQSAGRGEVPAVRADRARSRARRAWAPRLRGSCGRSRRASCSARAGLGLYFVSGRVDPEVIAAAVRDRASWRCRSASGSSPPRSSRFSCRKRLGLFDSDRVAARDDRREPRDG